MRPVRLRLAHTAAATVAALALGCSDNEPLTAPEAKPATRLAAAAVGGFHWGSATPESQGMCASSRQLGCTRTLEEIWNGIKAVKYNTKRFLVIRNDKIIYDRG